MGGPKALTTRGSSERKPLHWEAGEGSLKLLPSLQSISPRPTSRQAGASQPESQLRVSRPLRVGCQAEQPQDPIYQDLWHQPITSAFPVRQNSPNIPEGKPRLGETPVLDSQLAIPATLGRGLGGLTPLGLWLQRVGLLLRRQALWELSSRFLTLPTLGIPPRPNGPS